MRNLLTGILMLSSLSAYATTVRITSFVYAEQRQKLAELCGVVEGGESPSYVRVEVDYTGGKPAVYNVVAGDDGKFCTTVITYRGVAQARVFGETESTSAKVKR